MTYDFEKEVDIKEQRKNESMGAWERQRKPIHCKEDSKRSLEAVCVDQKHSKYYSCHIKSALVVFPVWVSTLNIYVFDVCMSYV